MGVVPLQGTYSSEAPPSRSVDGRTERLGRRGRRHAGPLSPGTTTTQLTCDCLFSLKKCQSVRSQVCCSSFLFLLFSPPLLVLLPPPPTHPDFPCQLQRDQSDAARRIWIFQVQREDLHFTPPAWRAQTGPSSCSDSLCWAPPGGPRRHKPGPPVWERERVGSAALSSLSPRRTLVLLHLNQK